MPDHAEIKVGAITFTEPGTYRYEVTQVQGSDPDIVYDTHVGAFEFVVGRVQGELVAVGNGFWSPTFTNSYEPALNFTEAGGITLSAVMNGRDSVYPEYMVTVVPEDQASKALLLGRQVGQYVGVFRFPSAKDGQPATVDFFEVRDGKPIVFTKEDVGKTYRYSLVSAKGLSYPATAYDMAERTLAIEVGRRDDGRVTATTTVTTAGADSETYVYTAGEKPARAAVVSFVNTFAPRGQVRLGARVTLTGRELAGGRVLRRASRRAGQRLADCRERSGRLSDVCPHHLYAHGNVSLLHPRGRGRRGGDHVRREGLPGDGRRRADRPGRQPHTRGLVR